MKKHYQILIEGNMGKYPRKIVDVVCTLDELRVITRAMVKYVSCLGCGCLCVAKEGEGVSNRDFDHMFSDCI